MNNFVSGLFLICVLISTTNPSFSQEDVNGLHTSTSQEITQDAGDTLNAHSSSDKTNDGKVISNEGRSISDSLAAENNAAALEKQSKPLRSIFMGIYKNYKSTYLGNKTLTEYKQTLRETMKNKQQLQQQHQQQEEQEEQEQEQQQNPDNNQSLEAEINEDEEHLNDGLVTEDLEDEEEHLEFTTIVTPAKQDRQTSTLSPNRKRKNTQTNSKISKENAAKTESSSQQLYNIGPALNLSLDIDNSIVKVNLDGESLKELVTGRWLNDNTEEGRGKKYEMVTRILPLFILPFLIQSAIVPFLVTKLKLLLIKSMLVGKLAIFLLIISAFRNGNKMMQTYEVAPSYWAGEPSRRSELAAAASNMAYNGYRVEGKPAAWIN